MRFIPLNFRAMPKMVEAESQGNPGPICYSILNVLAMQFHVIGRGLFERDRGRLGFWVIGRECWRTMSHFDIHTIIMTADCCRLSVLNANHNSVVTMPYVNNVPMFLTSAKLSTSGTVPIVQSQHKSHGNNSNQRFNDVK